MNGQVSQRLHKYDNLKGFAIILIVLGHMLFLLNFPSVKFIRYFISIFHLPIFFFVAGYFSKIGPDETKKSFKRLIIPYLIVCTLYTIFLYLIGSKTQPLFIYPTMAMWFLVALFFMKTFLPVVDNLKFPVLTSFVVALLIGFIDIDPYILGITRFFAFYPVFLIGFYYKDYKIIFCNKYRKLTELGNNKYYVIILGIVTLAMCAFVAKYFPPKIIVLAEHYAHPTELILRFIVLVLGIGVTLILNYLASNKEYFLTKIGKNSMAVYLIHPSIVTSIQNVVSSVLKQNLILYLSFSIIVSLIIVFILSRDIVTTSLNKLFDFTYNLFFKNI